MEEEEELLKKDEEEDEEEELKVLCESAQPCFDEFIIFLDDVIIFRDDVSMFLDDVSIFLIAGGVESVFFRYFILGAMLCVSDSNIDSDCRASFTLSLLAEDDDTA